MKIVKHKILLTGLFTVLSILIFSNTNFAQSGDPDSPSPLKNGELIGTVRSSASDEKTYYYSFNVKPGTLTLTTDMNPVKGTGGGTLAWTYLDTKFRRLKTDIYPAQGSPERRVDDSKITVKRRIILKVVVSGFHDYKLRFSGSGFVK